MQYSAAIYPTENEKTALVAGKRIRNFRRCCKEGPKPRMAMGSEQYPGCKLYPKGPRQDMEEIPGLAGF